MFEYTLQKETKTSPNIKKKLPNRNFFSFLIKRFMFSSSDSLWFFIFHSFSLNCKELFLETSASLLIFFIWKKKNTQ